jgi:hypothetical protein
MRQEIARRDNETSDLRKEYIFEESGLSKLKGKEEILINQVDTLMKEKQKAKNGIIALHKIIARIGYQVKQEELKSKEFIGYIDSMIEG